MIRIESRFETILKSPRPLVDAMTFRRHTVRSLTDSVNRELKRQRLSPVSRSTIGNLRSGAARGCRPEVARAIEEVLDVAPGALFTARVSNVQRETAREAGSVNLFAAIATTLFGLTIALAALWAVHTIRGYAEDLTAITSFFGTVATFAIDGGCTR